MSISKRFSVFVLCAVLLVSFIRPQRVKAVDPVTVGFLAVGIGNLAINAYRAWREAHPNAPESDYTGYNPGGVVSDEYDSGGHFASSGSFGNSYSGYVETLPATGISNSGSLYMTLPLTGISFGSFLDVCVVDDSCHAHARNRCNYVVGSNFTFTFSAQSSFNGSVAVLGNSSFSLLRGSATSTWDNLSCSLRSVVVNVGDTISCSCTHSFTFSAGETVVFTVTQLPVVSCMPFTPVDVSSTSASDTYNVYTRPASITGDYGIMTQSGDVQRVDSQSIVNETDNSVYNPVTNTTHTVTDWNYDYSDRSYHCTTQEGDTVTVTYGDEHITIQEGAETYNVYYLIESDSGSGSGSGGSDTPAHTHDYSSTVTRAATCTRSGVRTYTCSGCNATYQETIPATGHSWELVQETHTNYNSDGTLSQQGYSVYQCSVCGEQYRVDDTAGALVLPNSSSLGDVDADQSLLEIVQKVKSWGSGLTEAYSEYTSFMVSVLPYLPPELLGLINWGLGALFFTGVFRRFFWR